MKSKTATVMSVLAALLVVLCTTGPVEAGPPERPDLQSGAPTVISYQGQVIADGSPYNGTGYFMFAIVDADENVYWTNDGQEPAAGVPLTVTDGLFDVLLGDTTLTNMTEPLTAESFAGTGRYLRVWFSADDSTYLLLDPDRRITAAPYALQAQEAVSAASAATAAYATNADRLDGQHGSYYQARVSGACAVGSTVRAINADGTVVCQAGALNRAVAPTGNANAALDGHGVGMSTSVTIGTDGLPLISYYSDTGDWKVAHCDNLACTSFTLTTLGEDSWHEYKSSSVIIGADGLPLIIYGNRVAHCDNLACTSAAVNGLPGNSENTSVTIGADGLPLISGGSRVTHCNDLACTSTTETMPVIDLDMAETSVTIGTDGLPLISYCADGGLEALHCDDLVCTSGTNTGLDSGSYPSVAIGTDGLPLISYYDTGNQDLKVAHCNNTACTGHTFSTLDSSGNVGLYTSVTIGADGLGLISYYDATNGDLKVAHCTNLNCTHAAVTTLDSTGDVGQYTSVTIGADGLPLISYYDATRGDLKVAHCGSAWCVGYFRRR
jgi:hypothetical protein